MHAAGLTYFAMLSLVPLLCVLLSVAKFCGADDFARDQINSHLDAMISNVEHAQEDELANVAPISEEERERRRIAAEEFASQAREISNKLFERIAQFDVWTFGWIGFGFLVWTVISAISMVETSFNDKFLIITLFTRRRGLRLLFFRQVIRKAQRGGVALPAALIY